MTFDEYELRKTSEARAADIAPLVTERDQAGEQFAVIGNAWSRAMFGGLFYVSPAAPAGVPSANLVFVQSRDGNTVTADPSSLDPLLAAGLAEAFERGGGHGLLRLGADEVASSLPPGLRYWRDGRDAADVMVGTYDYAETPEHPAFNLQLRVNLADGGGGDQRIALIGTEGEMLIDDRGLTLSQSRLPDAPGFGGWDTYETFDAKTQQEFAAWYAEHYRGKRSDKIVSQQRYEVEPGYSDHLDHHHRFIQAVRGGGVVVEDAAFGFRAAAAALASNLSLAESRVIGWDPVAMRERA